jgi:uncharacterized repeat protein (TIGR03803 family)
MRDEAGDLYSTTEAGGLVGQDLGVVFKLDRADKETVLHTFTGGADGAFPFAGLIRDDQGNLYGTTRYGGTYDVGTVFNVDPTGKEAVLYSFTGGTDGANPYAGLIRDKEGNLYGTTLYGGDLSCTLEGPFGCGVVFRIDRSGQETVLHSFTGGGDGGFPAAGLIQDEEGNLYGTTQFGGLASCSFYCGVVFKLDLTGKETVLHSFTGYADGSNPFAGLIRDETGNLYGTASAGGPGTENNGVVFKLDRMGKETVLHTFTGARMEHFPLQV